jgi:hypothetical protein
MVDVTLPFILGVILVAQTPAAEPVPSSSVPAAVAPAVAAPETPGGVSDPVPATAPAVAETAPAASKPRLWVAPVVANGVAPDLLVALNEAVASEAGQVGSFEVMTESDMAQILSVEQRKQLMGCADPSCVTDLGKVANVDRVLTCVAAAVNEDVQVTCRVLGVKEAAQLASRDRKVVGKSMAVAEAARAVVGLVLTGQARERRGLVQLKVSEPGASVMVDGRVVGSSPIKEPFHVDEGRREILVKKGGYATWRTTVEVQAGTYTALDADLSATRTFQLWPFAIASFLLTSFALGPGVGLGLAAGGAADCYYWGRINPYDIPSRLPGKPLEPVLSKTSPVCHKLPVANPAYKERPIDQFQFEDRQNQWMAAAVLSNVLYGVAGVVAVVSLFTGASLLVTDVAIKAIRREE